MKIKKIFRSIALIVFFIEGSSFNINLVTQPYFPYKEAGLTERQAAAHLLSRFTFGIRPNDIDEVIKIGLEKWFRQQLNASHTDATLNEKLKSYDALKLSNREVMAQFADAGQLKKMIVMDGILSKDSIAKIDTKEFKGQLQAYRNQKGLRSEKELFRQLFEQKILRAYLSENQLHEVLTDFWFNHFNVSLTKNQCARFIPAYERDAIRPHVTGKFEELLLATAKSPAMLIYLDNASSVGENPAFDKRVEQLRGKMRARKRGTVMQPADNNKQQRKKSQGLNENYAREVMELHTLGVDGGYTQADVTEAARILTGWTIYPISNIGPGANMKQVLEKIGEKRLAYNGFKHEGDFLFAINRHDSGSKKVLGKSFSNGGYQEGVNLLTFLARHPSTAKFISRKLAVHFVSDNPPQSLVDKMTKIFLESNGDIAYLLTSMVTSKEFWSAEALRSKIKSPFEYGIGAIRSFHADVQNPILINQWITKMGQQLYRYQAPTGFPDKGQYWINTGSLLNRMNFGLAIASKRIPGISFDLAALANYHEPESAEIALSTYAKILLPERELNETLNRLAPLINQPDIQKNVEKASQKDAANEVSLETPTIDKQTNFNSKNTIQKSAAGEAMLAQVVGIIIGSPEFQRK